MKKMLVLVMKIQPCKMRSFHAIIFKNIKDIQNLITASHFCLSLVTICVNVFCLVYTIKGCNVSVSPKDSGQ